MHGFKELWGSFQSSVPPFLPSFKVPCSRSGHLIDVFNTEQSENI